MEKFKKRFGFTGSTEVDEEVTIDDDAIKKGAKFLYPQDVLSSEERVEEAVTARRE